MSSQETIIQEEKDQKWMYFSALTACSSSMCMSLAAAWTSPTIPRLLLTSTQAGILDALLPGGAVFGCVLAACTLPSASRKNLLQSSASFFLLGWIFLGFASGLHTIYLGRFVSGMGVGLANVVTGIYLVEISTEKSRGSLFACAQLFTNLGLLVEYSVGPFVTYDALIFVSIIQPFAFTILSLFLVESPVYFLIKQEKVKAEKVLKKLRGTEDVQEELKHVEDTVLNWETDPKWQSWRPVLVVSGACLLKTLSGGVTILSLAEPVLRKANLPADYASLILGVSKMAASFFVIFVTRCMGIKKLLIVSCAGVAFFLSSMAAYFYIQNKTTISTSGFEWVPLVCMILYFVFMDFGIGPFPSFLGAEVLEPEVKGRGTAIAIALGHFATILTMFLATVHDLTIALSIFALFTLLSIPLLKRYLHIDLRPLATSEAPTYGTQSP